MSANFKESKLIVAMPEYQDDVVAQHIWNQLGKTLRVIEGIYYYKHPIIGSQTGQPPDFCLLPKDYQPIALRSLAVKLEEIDEIENGKWKINGTSIDSPLAELDDFVVALESKFRKERELRRAVDPVAALVFPNISQSQFVGRFPNVSLTLDGRTKLFWKDDKIETIFQSLTKPLTNIQWQLAQAVFQSTSPMNRKQIVSGETSDIIGIAVKLLDRRIALLDEVQHRTTVQIPPGPQRIRGLAGTGKTILLTMRAAYIHQRFPDAKILFTFNTQSLYNQARDLITRFYRDNAETDPNWDNLHIRHAWGSGTRPGVYRDTCQRLALRPWSLMEAKQLDQDDPFSAACHEILKAKIDPIYDFVLADEAQDFPKEFFQLLYRITKPPKKIYWAFDELQSLSAVELPSPEDCFGFDESGNPNVSLSGEYPGPIDKDVVLSKSYRCPLDVLMLAHAIGLGINSTKGCVQMVTDEATWKALGYELESGTIKTDSEVVLIRPLENSPNHMRSVYTGSEDLIEILQHETRDQELRAVAAAIARLVHEQQVPPHQIVVVSLDSARARNFFVQIQLDLKRRGIDSVIPGLVDGSSEFGEEGRVTLSTVYRAKGNEAPVVFIISFDYLFDYVEEVENRNRAFTCISRSKGWIKISGCGEDMTRAREEIAKIRENIPRFKFRFPSLEGDKVRKLGRAETARRRREQQMATTSVDTLLQSDDDALESLSSEQRHKLMEKLRQLKK